MSDLAQTGRTADGTDWAASALAPNSSLPSPLSSGLLARILPGMVGREYGLDTLCVYLAIARTALLDLVVALGLPTPHDRAHRRAGGRNPWPPGDIPTFIALWMAGWHAASLGERFGRSPGRIWSKARQLGLPRRDRKALFRPGDPYTTAPPAAMCGRDPANSSAAVRAISPTAAVIPDFQATLPIALPEHSTSHRAEQLATSVQCPPSTVAADVAQPVEGLAFGPSLPLLSREAALVLVPAAVLRLPGILRKGLRQEIDWTTALDDETAERHWAFQHYKGAACEMGMSAAAMRSRKTRLELPMLPRGETVEEFNPAWAADTIAAYGYVKKRCKAFWELRGVEFFFWSSRSANRRFSKLARSKVWFRDSADLAAYGC